MRFGMLILLAACQDNKVGSYNTPPTVSVLSPATGTTFEANTLVELLGAADDAQDSPSALTVAWESSIDGVFNSDPPDADGNLYVAISELSSGDHVITLSAIDTDAESASTSLTLTIGPGATDAGAPRVTVLGPTEGQTFNASETINLVAAVTDDEDASDLLAVEVIDSVEGSLWTGYPSNTGSLTVPLDVGIGTHTLYVYATDTAGNVGTGSVNYEVIEDGRPRVNIDAPIDGSSVDLGVSELFRGTVSDDETAVDALTISWSSDVDGVFGTNPSDSSGAVSTSFGLSGGYHTITLAATDSTGLTGTDAIVVFVDDPLGRDDDGDGYTENDGDCADDDPTLNPGATDVCDGVDNDCSGFINDEDWDSYEQNDSSAAPYDCGEVDATFGWSNSTLTLSGLTLSSEDDEDWFTWDADDEIWDNITVSVTASGFAARGNYVIELYDEDLNIVDSDDGSASLSISHTGEVLDDDEDTWYIRVYASTWPSGTCNDTYSLVIHS